MQRDAQFDRSGDTRQRIHVAWRSGAAQQSQCILSKESQLVEAGDLLHRTSQVPWAAQMLDSREVALSEQKVEPATLVSGHRSEEHTSELQSQSNLVCRLLL